MRDMQQGKGKPDRCGARTRSGQPCKAKGYGKGGRCKNHGGMSTGARTPEGRAKLSEVVKERWARWREEKQVQFLAEGSDTTAKLVRQANHIIGQRLMERLVHPPHLNPRPQHRTKRDLDFEIGAHPFLAGRFRDGHGCEHEPHTSLPTSAPIEDRQERQDFRPLESGIAIDEPDDDYWKD